MSRRVGFGIAAAVLLMVAVRLSFNASEDEVAVLVVPSTAQPPPSEMESPRDRPTPIDDERELVIRFRGASSRPTQYSFLQVVPDAVRHCVLPQVVCRGTFAERDFRQEYESLLVFAPPGCRAVIPESGFAKRTWVVYRDGEARIAKDTELVPDGNAVSIGDYETWPPCPSTDDGGHN